MGSPLIEQRANMNFVNQVEMGKLMFFQSCAKISLYTGISLAHLGQPRPQVSLESDSPGFKPYLLVVLP